MHTDMPHWEAKMLLQWMWHFWKLWTSFCLPPSMPLSGSCSLQPFVCKWTTREEDRGEGAQQGDKVPNKGRRLPTREEWMQQRETVCNKGKWHHSIKAMSWKLQNSIFFLHPLLWNFYCWHQPSMMPIHFLGTWKGVIATKVCWCWIVWLNVSPFFLLLALFNFLTLFHFCGWHFPLLANNFFLFFSLLHSRSDCTHQWCHFLEALAFPKAWGEHVQL